MFIILNNFSICFSLYCQPLTYATRNWIKTEFKMRNSIRNFFTENYFKDKIKRDVQKETFATKILVGITFRRWLWNKIFYWEFICDFLIGFFIGISNSNKKQSTFLLTEFIYKLKINKQPDIFTNRIYSSIQYIRIAMNTFHEINCWFCYSFECIQIQHWMCKHFQSKHILNEDILFNEIIFRLKNQKNKKSKFFMMI